MVLCEHDAVLTLLNYTFIFFSFFSFSNNPTESEQKIKLNSLQLIDVSTFIVSLMCQGLGQGEN